MSLAECRAIRGFTTMLEGTPDIHVHHDVLLDPGRGGGVFDRARRLVPTTAYGWAIPRLHFVHAPQFSRIDPDGVAEDPSGRTYLFAGECHDHFGHFIIGTLSRLWTLRQRMSTDVKLLFQNREPVAELIRHGFQRDVFAALGLGPDDFATFDEPVRLRRLIVPSASFEENNVVYPVFRTMCHAIGEAATGDRPAGSGGPPVYLTKHRLASGVSRLVNEAEVAEIVARAGVDVISPETLSFAEQVRLWTERRAFAGWTGSALHTSAFAPARRLLVLHYEHVIYSNQLLIDRVNGNDALHLHPAAGIEREPRGGSFGNSFRLAEPRRVAEDVLRALDRMQAQADQPVAARAPRRRAQHRIGGDDFGLIAVNAGAGKPCTQSSTSQWSRHDDRAADAAGACSGVLTGRHQFHTGPDLQAWWSVDLQQPHRLSAIRLYNRCDQNLERAARFEIVTSLDGADWTVAVRKEDPSPFGGLIGEPFCWTPATPHVARFVCVRLLDRNFLHLDQVEIIGEPES